MSKFERSIDEVKNILDNRLKYNLYTTEDTVRYLLYYSVLKQSGFKLDPNKITLERKYSSFTSKNIMFLSNPGDLELDTYIEESSKTIDAIELKYHRNNGKVSYDTTNRLGELINEINRLICLNDDFNKYLFYITDEEMNKYINGNSTPKEIKEFYHLNYGSKVDFVDILTSIDNKKQNKHLLEASYDSVSKIYIQNIKALAKNYEVVSLLDYNEGKLSKSHYLRIYKLLLKSNAGYKKW